MQKYIASLVHTSIFRTRALTQRLLPGLRTARHLFMLILVLAGAFQPQAPVMAAAGLTIIPLAWNITGLDSNDVTVGPNVYPAGFRVCNTDTVNAATNVTSTWNWDTSNAYINLRSGSRSSITTASLAPNTCVDHYYEIEITRTTLAYSTARRFHVTATSDQVPAGVSTVTPREIYVQKIVSQARNNVTDVLLNGASIPIGGTLNVVVGGTYDITLIADTATNGFEQIETYIDLYNTIFRINKVTTAYSANGGTDPNAGNKLYADGCGWVNDPTLPTYRSCSGTGKYGGIVTITYNVTILSGGGTSQILNSLIFDYSGTSYHYNKDFPAARFLSILLPPVIAKAFNPSTIAAGAISTLTFTITNPNANVPLQGVAFSDTFPTTPGAMVVATPPNASTVGCGTPTFAPVAGAGSISFSGGTIAAGGTCTIHVDVTAPVAGTYVNTSGPVTTIMGGAVVASNTATATLTVIQPNPHLSLTKTAVPNFSNPPKVGDLITYTLVATNDGNTTLTNVTITDPLLPVLTCNPTQPATLLPGATMTCTGTHALTQVDIDAGSVSNTATASGLFGTQRVSATASATVPVAQTRSISLAKSATPTTYNTVGQVITYTFVITNTGNVTLAGPFNISDDKLGTIVCQATPTPTLAPNASLTCTATHIITQADIDAGSITNIATAIAGNLTSNPATATVTAVLSPTLSITKVATETTFSAVGDVLHYTIVATNTGNVTLKSVTVTDANADGLTCSPANGSPLAPGAVMTCTATHTITQADLDAGVYLNTACVAGAPASQVCASSNVPATQTPALTITKSASPTTYSAVGQVITYTIVATNTGNITLPSVTVTDPSVSNLTCTPANGSPLAPGAVMNCTATHTITQTDIDNGTFANTACVDGAPATQACATTTVTGSKTPGLSITKSASPTTYNAVGQIITYTIVATNTGNTTLAAVTVTDPNVSNLTCTPANGSPLAPGAVMNCTASHTITQTDIDNGSFANTACVDGAPATQACASTTVTSNKTPALSITKSASPTTYSAVGQVITYTIVATNTGNTTLAAVTVTDPNVGNLTCTPANGSSLAPGAVMNCTATHTITQIDIDNGSFANTACVDGAPATQACASTTVTSNKTPALSITKTATPTTYNAVGQIITYTIVATNTGNTTLAAVTVTDPNVSNLSCTPANGSSLAPGAVMNCTATHTITQTDIDNGTFANTACVDGAPATRACASTTVTSNPNPHLSITKSASPTTYSAVGQIITYTIVATNDGNTTLAAVTVTDPNVSNLTCTPANGSSLAPGAVMNCTATHTITQIDIDNGSFANTACVDGAPATQACASTTVTSSKTPHLSITKSASPTTYSAVGQVITYTIVATNDGNTTLAAVTVTDPSVGNLTCTPANGSSLAPGAVMNCTATHTITQTDIDNGSFANTACVDGAPATQACASTTVTSNKTPGLTITKTAQETSFSAVGEVIHYTIVATNTGNTTLAAVTVTDPKVTGLTCIPANGSQLLPGASMTCTATHTITQADIDAGSFANTACVNATGATEACATKNVPSSKKPALTLVKTVTEKNFGAAGVVLHYTLVATNTGNTTISGVTITDPKLGTLTCTPAQPATLAPSETLTCTGTYITKAVDVTALVVNNTATATATGIPPVTASAKVPFVGLPIGIKTVSASNLPTLRWTMVWINQTNIPKLKARVSDPIPAGTVYAGVLVCTPASPLTITTSCVFEAPSAAYPRGRVIWEGTLGPDAGHKSPETAQNELTISFNTTVDSSVNKVVNVGTIDVDIDGNGTYTPNEMKVVTVTAAWNRPANKPKKLPATGFAPNVVTSLPAQPEYSLYQSYSDFSLEIPSLGVMTNIVGVPFANDAWDTTWLGNNAGYLAGTAFPTWDGNSVITGHVYGYNGLTGPFVNIGKLSWGQQIVIRAFGERYIYSVRSVQTVNPDDLSVLDHKDNPWVTLITCKEFDPASYSYRLRTVVQAVLIQVVDNLER